ncbi:hypothetical protein HY772_00850 [Candidatus Woesearchaeota archaeon]|nr:hypothetical protein [Candidatus Woesearchaeota archaeon]
MNRIAVFDTQESVHPTLLFYLHSNIAAQDELDNRYEAKLLEYKEQSGWNERFLRAQAEGVAAGRILSTFQPAVVHLPDDEQERFLAQNRDIGQGLELTCAIELRAHDQGYFFSAGVSRPDCHEHISEDHDTLEALVCGVAAYLTSECGSLFGAKVTPFIYTVKEDSRLDTEQKDGIQESLRELPSQELPQEAKDAFRMALEGMLGDDLIARGLRDDERETFERLYFSTQADT